MKQFILTSLESMTSFGYVVLVVAMTYIGWSYGASNGSAFIGLAGGFVLGLVVATVIFGLVLLGLGILRNTQELVLVSRLGPERAQEALRVTSAATSFMGLNSNQILSFSTNLYLWLFFAYMFLPLIFMIMAAFNTPSIPQAIPMESLTLHWFAELFSNRPLWAAVLNSIAIGLGVILLSLTLGLAGALLLTRLRTKARTFIYAVLGSMSCIGSGWQSSSLLPFVSRYYASFGKAGAGRGESRHTEGGMVENCHGFSQVLTASNRFNFAPI
ncbi:MAG: hypothetical protein AAF637_12900, partial [Pseudomonadota bacterium]